MSDACLDVIHRCLDTNPKTRISMEELADHPWIMHKMFTGEKKVEKEKIKLIEPIKEVPVKEVKKNVSKPVKAPVKPMGAGSRVAGVKK